VITLINSIPAWIALIIIFLSVLFTIIGIYKTHKKVSVLTIIWIVLIFAGTILLGINELATSTIVSSLGWLSAISGFILLMVNAYRSKIRYNSTQKKFFWIYVIGLGGLILFLAVGITILNLNR
jgi:drug/metabolite transporter (DMT)-like permease